MNLLAYRLAVRWTVGDVSASGFEALRLSVHCALRMFGDSTRYVVCVNSVGLSEAKARTGPIPGCVEWLDNSRELAPFLAARLDKRMGEGVAWKLAPLRLFPARHELSLDNDVILWRMPNSVRQWLGQRERCLIAQDVERCLGQLDEYCPEGAYNSGIRGLPPEFNFEQAMQTVIARHERRTRNPLLLASELDEQGLQVAAASLLSAPHVISTRDVTICSPFWPKQPSLGQCGAHFVGLNTRHLPWDYYDRPADSWMFDHWERHRNALYGAAQLTPSSSKPISEWV